MYDTQIELYKGDDSVQFDEIFDDPSDRELTSVLYKSVPVLESGQADRIVIWVAKDGQPMEIIERSAGNYDPKEIYVAIEEIKERYGA